MKHIYYLAGILFLMYELSWIFNTSKHLDKKDLFKALVNSEKDKTWDNNSDQYKEVLITFGLPQLCFTVWIFIGLFTFNWIVFLSFLLINVFLVSFISKNIKNRNIEIVLHFINSMFGAAFLVFVIINSYHLKIELIELFKSMLT